jgi:hypothetical protein
MARGSRRGAQGRGDPSRRDPRGIAGIPYVGALGGRRDPFWQGARGSRGSLQAGPSGRGWCAGIPSGRALGGRGDHSVGAFGAGGRGNPFRRVPRGRRKSLQVGYSGPREVRGSLLAGRSGDVGSLESLPRRGGGGERQRSPGRSWGKLYAALAAALCMASLRPPPFKRVAGRGPDQLPPLALPPRRGREVSGPRAAGGLARTEPPKSPGGD